MNVRSLPSRAAKGAVKVYQRWISEDYNGVRHSRCMYTPSCSAYMQEAISQDGVIGGGIKGLLRLTRCTPQVAEQRMTGFARGLLTSPDDATLDRTFAFQDEAARDLSHQIRKGLSDCAGLMRSGQAEEGKKQASQWTDRIKNELYIRLEDSPHPQQSPRFVIATQHQHTPRPVPQRGWLHAACTATASVVTATAGALVGGALLGTAEALVSGFLLAPVAATDRTDAFNGWLSKKYGADSVMGVAPFEKRAGQAGYVTSQFLRRHLHSSVVAAAAGLLVGVPVGLVRGFIDGARTGGEVGWTMGRILGRNATDDAFLPRKTACENHP